MAGWGTGAWGTGPWGGGAGAAPINLAIEVAYAVAVNVVRVEFDAVPRAESGFSDGDALNPTEWVVSRVDTGAASTLTVVAVRAVSAQVFEVLTLEDFGPYGSTMRVAAPGVVYSLGAPSVGATYDFAGVSRS